MTAWLRTLGWVVLAQCSIITLAYWLAHLIAYGWKMHP